MVCSQLFIIIILSLIMDVSRYVYPPLIKIENYDQNRCHLIWTRVSPLAWPLTAEWTEPAELLYSCGHGKWIFSLRTCNIFCSQSHKLLCWSLPESDSFPWLGNSIPSSPGEVLIHGSHDLSSGSHGRQCEELLQHGNQDQEEVVSILDQQIHRIRFVTVFPPLI